MMDEVPDLEEAMELPEEVLEEAMEAADEASEDDLSEFDDAMAEELLAEEALEESVADDMLSEEESLESLEAQIETAVSELSDEELAEEVDEETLLGIVSEDDDAIEMMEDESVFDELDTLASTDLKAALGESVEEPIAEAAAETLEVDEIPEEVMEEIDALETVADTPSTVTPNEGLEALQTLMKALENEEVAKSLKGMNISIKISFGDKD